jgi:hypothetical protein
LQPHRIKRVTFSKDILQISLACHTVAQSSPPDIKLVQETLSFKWAITHLDIKLVSLIPAIVGDESLGRDYTARDSRRVSSKLGTLADAETLQQYMNPYQQLVTDVQKREAQKQSDIMGGQIEQQATQAGGLGGYREAIMQAERQRNLGQQLQDIQATGDTAAYQQALQAFEQDRAARGQEEQFRQQAFGTTEEARQAQQRMAIDSFQAGEQARQQAASFGMTAQQQEDAQASSRTIHAVCFWSDTTSPSQQQALEVQTFQAGEQARQQAAAMGLDARNKKRLLVKHRTV